MQSSSPAATVERRRHLPVAPPVRRRPASLAVVVLAALAAGMFVASLGVEWWSFKLYAPQYPKGLTLLVSLTGMGGDVHEIDLLNHYIGMSHLADAAPVERRLAGWGVAAIAILTLAGFAAAGRKLNKLVALPAVLFPVGFLADSFYWLYRFGHALDPRAPIKLGSFTPQMFGNGTIGQFDTFAEPGLGFWLACGGVACAIVATVLRARVCGSCPDRDSCGAVCPRLMVLRRREQRK